MGSLAGQFHAERLLDQQQDTPADWRKFYLVFAGTVWRDSDDSDSGLYVPCLHWDDDGWHLRFRWLDDDWGGRNRLVRLRK